jgi:hypothetical protein
MITAEWFIAPLAAIAAELIAALGATLSFYDDVIVALLTLHSSSSLSIQAGQILPPSSSC